MDIRNFITLKKIAELESFSRAAEVLGYAQSTISTHISDLEQHYGQPLLDRLGKRVVLTQFGMDVLANSHQTVERYDALLNFGRENEIYRGTIRIGAPESLMMYRLYRTIHQFKQLFPEIELIIKSDLCTHLRQMTLDGELDFAILLQPLLNYKGLITLPLKEESFCLIAPTATPQTFIPTSNQLILFTESECTYRDLYVNFLMTHGVPITNTLETSSVEAIKKYVRDGLGMSFVPRYALDDEILQNSLAVKPHTAELKFHSQIVYHKQKTLSTPLQHLINQIQTASEKW